MNIHLEHSLSSDMGSVIRHIVGDRETLVALTNIEYAETEHEIRQSLRGKLKHYPETVSLVSTPHDLYPHLINASTDLLVIDNVNLWVSNQILAENMGAVGMEDVLRSLETKWSETLKLIRDRSFPDTLTLSANVDGDLFVNTEQGRWYQRFIHIANTMVLDILGGDYYLMTGANLIPTSKWA